jgi:hypothetical protein
MIEEIAKCVEICNSKKYLLQLSYETDYLSVHVNKIFTRFIHVVKPVLGGHLWDKEKVAI